MATKTGQCSGRVGRARCKMKVYKDSITGLCRDCLAAKQAKEAADRQSQRLAEAEERRQQREAQKVPLPRCVGVVAEPVDSLPELCGKELERSNRTGYCVECLNNLKAKEAEERAAREREQFQARRQALAASQERIAVGEVTGEDALRRDNGHLRGEVSRLTALVNAHESRTSVEDRAVAEILDFLEANPYRPQLAPRPDATPAGPKDHQMMLVVSDAHFPEVVDPLQTFGLSYGPDVCKRRMTYLRDKLIRYIDLRSSAFPIRKVTLAVNGDMLSGDIHEELAITNFMPTSQALTEMSYMLYDFGSAVSEMVEDVEMIVMPGNHPRLTKKPMFKQKWNNWETVMGHFVAGLAKDRFTVTVPKDLVYRHKIFDRTIGISHGDGVKAQSFAGIPHYAMEKRRTKLQSLLRQVGQEQLDMLVYGHFHQLIYDEGQGCSLLINGSIKGGDEFSTGTTYSAQTPVQALCTFHPRHGLTDLSRINLGGVNE